MQRTLLRTTLPRSTLPQTRTNFSAQFHQFARMSSAPGEQFEVRQTNVTDDYKPVSVRQLLWSDR